MKFILIIWIFLLGLNLVIPMLNKKSNLAYFLLVVFSICLFSFNTNNSDYQAYLDYYNGNSSLELEFGFSVIVRIAKSVNLSFFSFRIIISTVLFYIIHRSLKYYNVSREMSLSLILLLSFNLDLVQIRFWISTVILYIAFINLINKRKIMFVITVIISSLFHVTTLIVLPLILFNKKYFRESITLLSIIVVCLSSFFFFDKTAIIYLQNYIGDIAYFDSIMNFGTLLFWFLIIIISLGINYNIAKIEERSECADRKNFITLMKSISIYILLFFPLFLFNSNFTRVIRIFLPLIVILVMYTIGLNREIRRKKILFINIMIAIIYFRIIVFPEITIFLEILK